MPKNEKKEGPIMLGKPGNKVKIGVVGMPNIGKSSLYNILSGQSIPAENYPFCTIDPSTAVIPVPDERFEHLCKAFNPKSKVPAVLHVTDIAGLVKGASEGKGMGNEFLSNIQAVDAIYHVCRAFVKKSVEHVEGTINPVRDIEIIRDELIAKDLAIMKNTHAALEKKMRTAKEKSVKENFITATKTLELLEDGKEVRNKKDWLEKDVEWLNTQPLLTAKPMVYLINVTKKNYIKGQNKFFKHILDWIKANDPDAVKIPFSVTFEQAYLDANNPAEFLKAASQLGKNKKLKSMVEDIIVKGYEALNLVHYFTVGSDEVRAWTIKKGTIARDAAGVIHTDFRDTFIQGKVYGYNDFKVLGGEKEVKTGGKLKTVGKDTVIKDGDICHWICGAGRKKKK